MVKLKANQEQKPDAKAWSILSIIATVISIAIWIYCFAVSGGSTNESGPGAVWWFLILYYSSLGIPLAIASIAFGIIGLKTNLRWLSIISLSLKAIMIITIAVLLLVTTVHPSI